MDFPGILAGILQGLRVTALVTLYGMLWAVPFALCFGVLQYFTRGWTRAAVTAVIEFWRSSPVLILLFMLYYTLPSFGITLSSMTVGAMALGLNIGGYGSQAVRAALQALDRGQVEAGLALGLRRLDVLLTIELPQALAAMLPTFVNQFIQLVKGTAVVSLITLTDMTFRAKEIAELTYNPIGIYTALLVAYLIVCYPATLLGRWLENRVGIAQRGNREI
ncbi:amino acid ABC transporter permease [Bordetella genomosp. 9]|uniref:ABC transporter n=1 Tax=Bordetella genomosp. 9 TaxID=1416803 RepID=A0A1W6YWF7_9BORD|nr:amino acid ABC transporter permease [Bordetella genomosp. 9]ARP85427.1 ABC transporter [Bordetella genomosp. 9]ARP89406.1 ABC transporter [Bordetella genomosp. 9]